MRQNIDVFILCGGKGSRLKKISGNIPKPLIPIGKRPFLDIIITHLQKSGFKRFILGIGYQAHIIKEYYQTHIIPGVEILFSQEDKALGTGGAVKKAKRFIKTDAFFVFNGDSFSEFNATDFIKFFKQKNARALMLLKKEKKTQDFGIITTNRKSEITSFREKDLTITKNFINGGVYLFSKNIFSKMPKEACFSLEYDFFPQMIGQGLYGYKNKGFFIDIGTPERYFAAKKHFPDN